jgi:PucR C-terminal helix-turn-helix domain/GGDEF-like domain
MERLANQAIARIEPGAGADLSRGYEVGTERAVEAVIDYVLACVIAGSTAAEPVPLAVLDQTRRAARAGVALDIVLRRHTAGDRALRRILGGDLAKLDRAVVDDVHVIADEAIDVVMRCVVAEFEAEAARLSRSPDPALALTIRLLKKEVGVAELDGYILNRWHAGVVTEAALPRPDLQQLAADLDAQPLVVDSRLGQHWIWIGASRPIEADAVEASLTRTFEQTAAFGVGEPRKGLSGWRLTHGEARRAAELPGADGSGVTRMRKNVLEAAVLENGTLTESLIATYIEPLEDEPAKLATDLRKTLRAYLSSGQNAKSAAALLGIDRHTVLRRVRKVEDLVGERIEDCFARLDTALRLATTEAAPHHSGSSDLRSSP